MTPERWRQIESLFQACLEMPAGERAAYLEKHCGEDAGLRSEVEAMLAADEDQGQITRGISGHLEAAVSAESLQPGQRVGPFSVEELIGQGGMGQVYRARRVDQVYDQQVVIKVLSGIFGSGLKSRFHRERQILANLDHPNIARLLDGGELSDGQPYLIMEYIRGQDIVSHCRENDLGLRRRLELFRKICLAAHSAHQQLIVHCDIKPGNVMVNHAGEPRLLDFGVATLLAEPGSGPDPGDNGEKASPEMPLVSPAYASPEQLTGAPVNTATDVYSLGSLLYVMLTDQPAYETGHCRSSRELREVVCEQVLRPPSEVLAEKGESGLARRIRGDLDAMVLRAMERDPARRYEGAGALVEEVERYLAHRPLVARSATPGYRAGKFLRRNPRLAGALGALSLVAVAFVSSVTWLNVRLAEERTEAIASAETSELSLDFMVGLFDAADPVHHQGQEVSARELLDQGASRIEELPELDPEVRARLIDSMAEAFRNMGQRERALDLFGSVRAARKRSDESDRDAKLDLELRKADLKREMGHYDTAAERLEALIGRLEAEGTEDVYLARGYNNRGIVYMDRDRAGAAEEYTRKALETLDRLDEEYPEQRAIFLHNLANSLHGQRSLEEAAGYYRESLEIKYRHLGERHPSTLNSQVSLSTTLRQSGDLAAAGEKLERAIETGIAVHGEESLATASRLNELANLYHDQGDYGAAGDAYRRSLEYLDRNPAEDPRRHTLVLNNLASLYEDAGDLDRAEPLFRRSLKIRRTFADESSSAVIHARVNKARLLGRQGRLEAADEQLQLAIANLLEHHPDNHQRLAAARVQEATLLSRGGQHERAREVMDEALALFASLESPAWRTWAYAWRDAVHVRRRSGDALGMAAALVKAERLTRQIHPSDHPERVQLAVQRSLLEHPARDHGELAEQIRHLDDALHDSPLLARARAVGLP